MPTPWLSASEMTAWRSFITTLGPLIDALEADLSAHGLTFGEYEVLVFLSEAHEHRMRMGDLADALRLSPSGLTRRLDRLVRDRLVERVSCPTDRRVMYAELTKAGMAKLRSAAPDHVRSVRRHLLDPLDARQVDSLGQIFSGVRARLGGECAG